MCMPLETSTSLQFSKSMTFNLKVNGQGRMRGVVLCKVLTTCTVMYPSLAKVTENGLKYLSVLDEILNLIESVSEDFPSYS